MSLMYIMHNQYPEGAELFSRKCGRECVLMYTLSPTLMYTHTCVFVHELVFASSRVCTSRVYIFKNSTEKFESAYPLEIFALCIFLRGVDGLVRVLPCLCQGVDFRLAKGEGYGEGYGTLSTHLIRHVRELILIIIIVLIPNKIYII